MKERSEKEDLKLNIGFEIVGHIAFCYVLHCYFFENVFLTNSDCSVQSNITFTKKGDSKGD